MGRSLIRPILKHLFSGGNLSGNLEILYRLFPNISASYSTFSGAPIARCTQHITEHRTKPYATFLRIDATFFSEFRKLSR